MMKTFGIRTGDTPQRERAAMLRNPPDILITTPESLYLMLTSRAREILAEGLDAHPGSPSLHYNLACLEAVAGRRDRALAELMTAIGIRPQVSWLAGAGVAVDDGVTTDEQLRTSAPGICLEPGRRPAAPLDARNTEASPRISI